MSRHPEETWIFIPYLIFNILPLTLGNNDAPISSTNFLLKLWFPFSLTKSSPLLSQLQTIPRCFDFKVSLHWTYVWAWQGNALDIHCGRWVWFPYFTPYFCFWVTKLWFDKIHNFFLTCPWVYFTKLCPASQQIWGLAWSFLSQATFQNWPCTNHTEEICFRTFLPPRLTHQIYFPHRNI